MCFQVYVTVTVTNVLVCVCLIFEDLDIKVGFEGSEP